MKKHPGTDLSTVAEKFEQRCHRWNRIKQWLPSANVAIFDLKCLLLFAAGAGLAQLFRS